MAVFNGKLFTGYPVAYAFDGDQWVHAEVLGRTVGTFAAWQTAGFTFAPALGGALAADARAGSSQVEDGAAGAAPAGGR